MFTLPQKQSHTYVTKEWKTLRTVSFGRLKNGRLFLIASMQILTVAENITNLTAHWGEGSYLTMHSANKNTQNSDDKAHIVDTK